VLTSFFIHHFVTSSGLHQSEGHSIKLMGIIISIIVDKMEERFWSKVSEPDANGCRNWLASLDHRGYGQFQLNYKMKKAHRIAYELIKGPIPEGLHILHSCDNPKCVNPEHLSTGTNNDNVKDKMNKNRQCKGIQHGKSKLTEAQVLEIRASDKTQQELANIYNLDQSTISYIKNNKLWKHL
jgi:hypothetical protein